MASRSLVLGVIPARGGSKSIPRKNLADVGGKPLVAHMIGHALAASRVSDVVVSTEDSEIAAVAKEYGAEVPFMRPRELAGDEVLSLPVVQHAVREMEGLKGCVYDTVVLLQPTAPLCRPEDIDACIERLEQGDCDSAVTVVEVDTVHPFRLKKIIDGDVLLNYVDQGFEDMRPRQTLPPVFKRSGAVYASKRSVVMEQDTLVGSSARAVIVPKDTGVDIDTPDDLENARRLYRQRQQETGAT